MRDETPTVRTPCIELQERPGPHAKGIHPWYLSYGLRLAELSFFALVSLDALT